MSAGPLAQSLFPSPKDNDDKGPNLRNGDTTDLIKNFPDKSLGGLLGPDKDAVLKGVVDNGIVKTLPDGKTVTITVTVIVLPIGPQK